MNPYNPYQPHELTELERLQQMFGTPPPSPDMGGVAQMPPAPPPELAPSPMAMPAAPPPSPAAQPLDLASAPAALRKGMGVSSVTTQGYSPEDTARLDAAHKGLTGEKLGQIESAGAAERGIAERGIGQANARGIEAANQEVAQRRALEESARKQQALRQEQDAWSQKKDDPGAAFRGDTLALVLSGIGLAAGTFSQLMGWQNGSPVKDTFNKAIDSEVAAQREQKNSRLNVLSARIGDERAAELQLRGELHESTALRIQAQMQGTQHQDALDRLGPLAQDQALKAKEAQLAASEALVPKQSVTQTPLKTPGAVDPIERAKKVAEAAKALEAAGASKETIAGMFKSAGLEAPTQKTAAELERDEKEAKKKELTPEERKDIRDRVDGLAEVVQGFNELDSHVGIERDSSGNVVKADDKKLDSSIASPASQIAGAAANTLPWGMNQGASELAGKMRSEEVKKLERIRDKIVFGQAKAEGQGALSGGDREVYRARIPTDSPLSLQRSTAEQWRQRRQQYQDLVGKYGQAQVDADFKSRGIDPAKEFGAEP